MAEGSTRSLTSAWSRTGSTTREMWLRYLALGGNADEVSVAGQLHGLVELPPGEFNVLAHAVNETLDDLPVHRRGERVAHRDLRSELDAQRRPH
jgi:hypothetical protein